MNYNYNALQAINNSALSKINPDEGGNPAEYRSFITEDLADSSEKHFTLGTNLHFVFLESVEPIVLDSVPSPALMAVITALIDSIKTTSSNQFLPYSKDLKDHSKELLSLIRAAGYQNNWKDETVLNDVLKKCTDYWDVLINAGDVPIISHKESALISKIRANIELRPVVKQLLSTEPSQDVKFYTELVIIFEENYTESKMKCKARLDRLRLNHATKTFSIIDFKSTGKPLESFQDSFEMYRYYRQLKFYENAVTAKLEKDGYVGYKPEDHYIIAVETFNQGRVRPFRITAPYLKKGELEIISLLKRIEEHTLSSQWEYSLEELINPVWDLIPVIK